MQLQTVHLTLVDTSNPSNSGHTIQKHDGYTTYNYVPIYNYTHFTPILRQKSHGLNYLFCT